jgi:hypothetical protein
MGNVFDMEGLFLQEEHLIPVSDVMTTIVKNTIIPETSVGCLR